ncbi:calmodulin-binding protein [Actinospica durhamensis]|uniref:Calmodulin-binding protein n=1 Tax=Actinospica durhamensis TaxID=1508375 RepID=A0A941EVQ9_9ACTN|nr:calmodulin-binding protein [Actinospica durhamensis]MBR7839042.1 calmodulin-binding protein [Actinospica durhamensis]
MRRTLKTTCGTLVAAAAIALGAALPASAAVIPHAAETSPAYFEMTDVTGSKFVVKMTDGEDIEHARALVEGRTDQMPHVLGRIIKRWQPYNHRWSYTIDPASVTFFDQSIEVCDATIPYVEEHLDEVGGAFLPGNWWCGWSTRLVRELPNP